MSDVCSIDCAINLEKDDDVERVEVNDTSSYVLRVNYGMSVYLIRNAHIAHITITSPVVVPPSGGESGRNVSYSPASSALK
jgi:hypothetical protein